MPDRSPGRPVRGRRAPCSAVILDDPAWLRAIPDVVRVVTRASIAAEGAATVMLSSDRAVRALNRVHRGIDKPTNVLTFEPSSQDADGDIVLAFGVMRREAGVAGRGLADHLAHLVVHGVLHLHGEDHLGVGEARRMEMREARILRRLGVANPWKPRA